MAHSNKHSIQHLLCAEPLPYCPGLLRASTSWPTTLPRSSCKAERRIHRYADQLSSSPPTSRGFNKQATAALRGLQLTAGLWGVELSEPCLLSGLQGQGCCLSSIPQTPRGAAHKVPCLFAPQTHVSPAPTAPADKKHYRRCQQNTNTIHVGAPFGATFPSRMSDLRLSAAAALSYTQQPFTGAVNSA